MCPKGSSSQTQCPAGYYCTDNGDKAECPIGSYCVAGSMQPTACPASANCPAGSTANPAQVKVEMSTKLGMGVADFVATYQTAFRAAVADWLGASVSSEDVVITCMCDTSCAANAGVTPDGTACGATPGARKRTRSLLQAANVTAVEYQVLVGSAAEQQSVVASASGSDGVKGLQIALASKGFSADVAQSADVTVYTQDTGSPAGLSEEDFTQVLITVMFAVPVAMLVVGLAMYQNSRKAKPVKLPGLIVAVLLAFYDFFSDVWFVVTPVAPEYVGFTIAAAVAVGVASLVGAGIVCYALWHHKVAEWGVVDCVTVVLAVTNTDLLALLPWEGADDLHEGMPDATTARLPVAGVVVEDLPQLFIQGFYLISSGDTGNIVVLVSVSVSGCSLLLRFVRGAFAFVAGGGESHLAETSPMKDWGVGRLSEWLAGLSASDPELETVVQRLQGLPSNALLRVVDAVCSAQPLLIKEAEKEAEERDRNKIGNNGVASSAVQVLGAAV